LPVPATMAALRAISGPVVLVTIVGSQRGGKSTLLNLLHSRKTAGFGVGHFLDAQTMGLWVWSRAHPRNPDVTVLLQDSEGLDSPGIPQHYNWTLAAVALLVSSYFIYQSKGAIDSHSSGRLGVILQVAEQLRGGRSDSSTDLPNFLWLIRDHQLKMTTTPKNEMMSKLGENERSALDRNFASSDCAVLPRPVDREADLQNVEQMDWAQLNENFREEYLVLERQIFNAVATPRRLSGRTITGPMLADLVQMFADALQKRDGIVQELSALPTQWQMVARMSGERALKAAIKDFEERIASAGKRCPMSAVQLAEANDTALHESLKVFKHEALVDDLDKATPELREYLHKFEHEVAQWAMVPSSRGADAVVEKRLVGGRYFELWRKNYAICADRFETAKAQARAAALGDVDAALAAFDSDVSLKALVGFAEARQELRETVEADSVRSTIAAVRGELKAASAASQKALADARAAAEAADAQVLARVDAAAHDVGERFAKAEAAAAEATRAARELASERQTAVAHRLDTLDGQVKDVLSRALDAVQSVRDEHKAAAAAGADRQDALKTALGARIDAVANELAANAKIASSVGEQFDARLDGLTKRADQLDAARAELDAGVRKNAEYADRLRDSIAAVDPQLVELRHSVATATAATSGVSDRLVAEVGAVGARIAALATEVSAHAAAAEQRDGVAAAQRGETDTLLQAVATELRDVETRVGAAHARNEELAAQLAAAQQESGAASAAHGEQLLALKQAVDGVAASVAQVGERVETVEKVANDSVTTSLASLQEARAALEQRVAQLEAQIKASAASVDEKLESFATEDYVDEKIAPLGESKSELDIANKQIELSRIAIEDLWNSLGQMGARVVGIEAIADEKLAAMSSARAAAQPQNKQKAMAWIDKFKRNTKDLLSDGAKASSSSGSDAEN
jgi:hypothetical protein